MARRRHNARPSRNQLRDIHRARERALTAPSWPGEDDDEVLDGPDADDLDPDEAARLEIEAFLASRDD